MKYFLPLFLLLASCASEFTAEIHNYSGDDVTATILMDHPDKFATLATMSDAHKIATDQVIEYGQKAIITAQNVADGDPIHFWFWLTGDHIFIDSQSCGINIQAGNTLDIEYHRTDNDDAMDFTTALSCNWR